ncbi:MAG: arginase [Gemmatimonadetes bacterium]|nr:arginase [Gemmatimonadota bacterium]MBT6146107.1 arginase [Gemmatimonadota bacterium]MBT7862456.1 arginase [Gemmatimonadota bacterium]
MNEALRGLQVIGVRYGGRRHVPQGQRVLDECLAADVYSACGVPVEVTEPTVDDHPAESEPVALGRIGGAIADVVAAARAGAKSVLMTGGNCHHVTGVVGGLQDVHGADARIGLVWFDAHGDINTPQISISGSLGGMPVSVCAGLSFPQWRIGSHITAALPSDRILMVDVRNLDPEEARLVQAVGIEVAAPAAGYPGTDLTEAVARFSEGVDLIYLHIDSDILDETLVPNHGTKEPDGPDMAQTLAAVDLVMATGKVVAAAVVSVFDDGDGAEIGMTSGLELIRGTLESWSRHGGC